MLEFLIKLLDYWQKLVFFVMFMKESVKDAYLNTREQRTIDKIASVCKKTGRIENVDDVEEVPDHSTIMVDYTLNGNKPYRIFFDNKQEFKFPMYEVDKFVAPSPRGVMDMHNQLVEAHIVKKNTFEKIDITNTAIQLAGPRDNFYIDTHVRFKLEWFAIGTIDFDDRHHYFLMVKDFFDKVYMYDFATDTYMQWPMDASTHEMPMLGWLS